MLSSERFSAGMVFWWVLKDKRERKANSRESIKESKRPGDVELARPATALGSVVSELFDFCTLSFLICEMGGVL